MTEAPENQPQRELAELWRQWLTQSERQMNEFLNQAMSTDTAGRGMGSFVELYAVFQRNMAQAMERYLTAMNIPSRTDITALAATLSTIEERLSRIERTLLIAAEPVDSYERRDESAEPPRTRRPRDNDASEIPAASGAVPDDLRR
jgi:hypothetical protein